MACVPLSRDLMLSPHDKCTVYRMGDSFCQSNTSGVLCLVCVCVCVCMCVFLVCDRIKQLRKVNRERSLAKPVIRARLRDSEDSDGEARVLRDVEEEEEEEILLQHRHQSHAVVRRTYVLGSTLPFKRDTTHEFK